MSTQNAGVIKLPSRASRTQTKKGGFTFELLRDHDARDWASRGLGKATWTKLCDECPWSTAYQSPGFFDVWSRHYERLWSPFLVIARRVDASVAGIMPLASRGGVITGAGAHQAEYHGWVSQERDAEAFITGALATLGEAIPGHTLRLRYLPPAIPAPLLVRVAASNPRVEVFRHVAHEFALDRRRIAEALKKKGNKSKQNRLARLGKLTFRKLDADAVAEHMDAMAAMYDFRQGARNGVCPFLDDPHKRAFHLDWIKSVPDQVHATGMFLGDRLISGLLLIASKGDAHLAIAAHAPDLADHSPNKLHIYEAAAMLADDGKATLDLTPGDDAWKERFSTGRRGIFELVMHSNLQRAGASRARKAVKDFARRTLAKVGLSKEAVLGRLRAARNGVKKAAGANHAVREDVLTLALASATTAAKSVACNDLDALIRWGGGLRGERRQVFLGEALQRIEAGERCFTHRSGDSLACMAWVSAAQDGKPPALYDFAAGRDQAALAQLRDLVTQILATLRGEGAHEAAARVRPRDAMTRAMLTALGFRPLTGSGPRRS